MSCYFLVIIYVDAGLGGLSLCCEHHVIETPEEEEREVSSAGFHSGQLVLSYDLALACK